MAISPTRIAARRISNTIFTIGCVGLTGVALFFLAAILWSLISQGIGGVNLNVFMQDTPSAGSVGGGLRNAIVGSVMMGAEAMVIAIILGVLAGTWLSEYAGQSRYGAIIRFLNDVLLSAPSILIGLFVWEVFVHHVVGHFSGFAGGIALALLASPVITRTTEDVLRLQPTSLRESGVALGTPVWTVTRAILWQAAGSGMLTGILLAFARISGETAPLLFTALGNLNFSTDMLQPMANLPKVIFDFALSADDNWRRLAWVGSLLIASTVLAVTIIARAFSKEPSRP
jgi:phosphate transport system permease protein